MITQLTTVRIVSFGYLHGAAPEATITLDLRTHFRDPHVSPELRYLTAHDPEVRRAVWDTPGIPSLVFATVRAVEAYMEGPSGSADITVAVGCAGGRHRAASVAREVATRVWLKPGTTVVLEDRDLDKDVVER